MNSEALTRQFDEIEQKVEKFVEDKRVLEDALAESMARVEELESRLEEKEQAESVYKEEKSLVRSKIDGLLVKLEGLAKS